MISAVVFFTLSIQLYWVFKNYEESKQQLQRDIKTSFDLTVADYFTAREKENSFTFSETALQNIDNKRFDSLIGIAVNKTNSIQKKSSKKSEKLDTLLHKDYQLEARLHEKKPKKPFKINSIRVFNDSNLVNKSKQQSERFLLKKNNEITDSLELIEYLPTTEDVPTKKASTGTIKAFSFSISSNVIDLVQLDSMMIYSLTSNDIKIKYGLKYNDGEDIFKEGALNGDQIITSNNSKLYTNTSLSLIYSGGESTLLKRNLTSLSLSFLLISGSSSAFSTCCTSLKNKRN